MRDYVLAERILSNDSLHAAGMQGQPQSLDDMTDGQIEDRFYQLVPDRHVSSSLEHSLITLPLALSCIHYLCVIYAVHLTLVVYGACRLLE